MNFDKRVKSPEMNKIDQKKKPMNWSMINFQTPESEKTGDETTVSLTGMVPRKV